MTFHHDAPNSHVPGFHEFLVNVLSSKSHSQSAKHPIVKSHAAYSENSLYLLLSNTLLIAPESKYNTNLKMYNTKVV